ncbi:MAG: mechanosensitive ion channel family protein [Anaerolineae bacterium]
MAIEASLQQLLADAISFVPRLIGALVLFLVVLAVAGRVAAAVARGIQRRTGRPELVLMLQRTAQWTIITLGALSALSMVKVDVTGFVAGLGVTGLVLGLALQDVARNFVAGVILLLRRPFQVGEAISVAGVEGSVVEINTRDTTIRRWDGEQAIIPNSTIFTSIITNYSRATLRQRTIRLDISRMQDVGRASEIIRQAAAAVPGVAAAPSPAVQAEGLGKGGMSVSLRFWADATSREIEDVHSEVALAVSAAIVREGVELA